jgi:hypothetical protein
MTNQHLTVWQHVTAEFSGRSLSGSYAIEDSMVKGKPRTAKKPLTLDHLIRAG